MTPQKSRIIHLHIQAITFKEFLTIRSMPTTYIMKRVDDETHPLGTPEPNMSDKVLSTTTLYSCDYNVVWKIVAVLFSFT